MGGLDIHNYYKLLEREKRKILRSGTCEENKRLILKYCEHLTLEDQKPASKLKSLRHLKKISMDFLKMPLTKATIEDIKGAVCLIEAKQDYSVYTKRDTKLVLKKFYQWLSYGEETLVNKEYPSLVSWIRPVIKKKDQPRVMASNLLLPEEITAMLQVTKNPRNRAFIGILYELGARIGEIGNLRIQDISRDQFSLLVDLNGKTGPRTVRVIQYAGELISWINLHPSNIDKSSPLWPSFKPRRPKSQLSYSELVLIIRNSAEKAGVKKRIYPHLFRHSRVTHLMASGKMNEAQVKVFSGWVPDSKVLSTYVHLVSKDANDAVLRMYGVETPNTMSDSLLTPICGMCKTPNSANSKFCFKCGYVLGQTIPEEVTARQGDAEDILMRFMQQPGIQELFKKMVCEEIYNRETQKSPQQQASRLTKPKAEVGSSL